MKATTTIIATISLTASALLSGCGTGEAAVSSEESILAATPVTVEVAHPFRADISSDADAPVVARATGEVVEILVEEGDRVTKGQVLARLDGERLRLEMLAAKANLKQASTEYERNIDLHERGLIAASTFDALQYDLEELEATYELKKLAYDYSNIRAPISGVVSSRDIKLGQHLSNNDSAFRITDTAELIAHLQIPQSELSKFAAGNAASIEVASMPDEGFTATIARISPTIDTRNGTFRATALISNAEGNLAPGMFGHFTISYEQHTDALVIPAEALIDEDDENTVYIVDDGEVIRRNVKIGIAADGNIEILDGLNENDVIVVVGHSGLRNGSKVLASNANPDSFTG
jgi:membrane fusion protein (multidrug efflux system)